MEVAEETAADTCTKQENFLPRGGVRYALILGPLALVGGICLVTYTLIIWFSPFSLARHNLTGNITDKDITAVRMHYRSLFETKVQQQNKKTPDDSGLPGEARCQETETYSSCRVLIRGTRAWCLVLSPIRRLVCTPSSGGWLLWALRSPMDRLSMNRSWEDYSKGFGTLNRNYWLGLYYLHIITSQIKMKMRVELMGMRGEKVWAEYQNFRVGSESEGFPLTLSGYQGNATMDSLGLHDGQIFTTWDRDGGRVADRGGESCPRVYEGGWWYAGCGQALLTADPPVWTHAFGPGTRYPRIIRVEMRIRPGDPGQGLSSNMLAGVDG